MGPNPMTGVPIRKEKPGHRAQMQRADSRVKMGVEAKVVPP